jgi:UDP-N-acetylglucosamine--N-acetylmuramyl-(pentapeptide) pyrophosphoryl-undecaprenol N-acetylglucosamine transferase
MFEGIAMHVLSSGTSGRGIIGKVRGAAGLATGMAQAFSLVRKLRPTAVVGFGGYPSFPTVYAAQRLNIPTVIHEQNAILGKANAMLAPRAERIALSYKEVYGLEEADRMRSVLTGNPVRTDIAALYSKSYAPVHKDGFINILVLGGSLGASVFSDVVPKALSGLHASYRGRIRIVQQCRAEDIDKASNVYNEAGIGAELDTFFENIAELFGWAHLIISRAGASTIAEVTAAGRPAIFVPYPHHADQQQKINADYVSDCGGAWTITQEGFTSEVLLARIETFLQNPETLFKAAEAARNLGRPDAARRLGNLVTALSSGWDS